MNSTSLNLRNLPCDVIKHIIRTNVFDNMNNLRLISRTWNVRVVEYITKLPMMSIASLKECNGEVNVKVAVHERYLYHFKSVCPDDMAIAQSKTDASLVYIRFKILMVDFNLFFSRLFKRTNHIYHISIRNLDKKTVNYISSSMGISKIDYLTVAHFHLWQEDFRKIIMKIVRKHRVDTLKLEGEKCYIPEKVFRKLISTIPQSVISLMIKFSRRNTLFTDETEQYWSTVANDVMKKREFKCFLIKSGEVDIFCKIDPIFYFLRILLNA